MSFLKLFSKEPSSNIRAITNRLDELESQFRLLKVEWTEVYDKVAHTLSRVVKRVETPKPPEAVNGTENLPYNPTRQYTEEELWKMLGKRQ